MSEWSDQDYDIINESISESVMSESFSRTPKNIALGMLECEKTFEEISEETGLSIDYIAELYELMQYIKSEAEKKENMPSIAPETGEIKE